MKREEFRTHSRGRKKGLVFLFFFFFVLLLEYKTLHFYTRVKYSCSET